MNSSECATVPWVSTSRPECCATPPPPLPWCGPTCCACRCPMAPSRGPSAVSPLRNVTDPEAFLAEVARAVRPGGRIALLEVAEPTCRVLRWGHRLYFGRVVRSSAGSCRTGRPTATLPDSLRLLPAPDQLADQLETASFDDVDHHVFSGGIAPTPHRHPQHLRSRVAASRAGLSLNRLGVWRDRGPLSRGFAAIYPVGSDPVEDNCGSVSRLEHTGVGGVSHPCSRLRTGNDKRRSPPTGGGAGDRCEGVMARWARTRGTPVAPSPAVAPPVVAVAITASRAAERPPRVPVLVSPVAVPPRRTPASPVPTVGVVPAAGSGRCWASGCSRRRCRCGRWSWRCCVTVWGAWGGRGAAIAASEAEVISEISRREGDKATEEMLCRDQKRSRSGARKAVKVAGQLEWSPEVADRLAEGAITPERRGMILDAAADALVDRRALLGRRRGRARGPAATHHQTDGEMTPPATRNSRRGRASRRRRRRASISEQGDGMFHLFAQFDPLTGNRIRAALLAKSDELFRSEDPKDRPTPPQRSAEALAELICNSHSDGQDAPVGAEFIVLADYDLVRERVVNARLADDTPLTEAEVLALACDARILPGIFNKQPAGRCWGDPNARSRRDCGNNSSPATAAASAAASPRRSARSTTSTTGATAGRPPWRTPACSVTAAITSASISTAKKSSDVATAASPSSHPTPPPTPPGRLDANSNPSTPRRHNHRRQTRWRHSHAEPAPPPATRAPDSPGCSNPNRHAGRPCTTATPSPSPANRNHPRRRTTRTPAPQGPTSRGPLTHPATSPEAMSRRRINLADAPRSDEPPMEGPQADGPRADRPRTRILLRPNPSRRYGLASRWITWPRTLGPNPWQARCPPDPAGPSGRLR